MKGTTPAQALVDVFIKVHVVLILLKAPTPFNRLLDALVALANRNRREQHGGQRHSSNFFISVDV